MISNDFQTKEKLNSHSLIAVSGVKGSGKDITANMIQYCLSVPKILRQYWIFKCFRRLFKPKYRKLAFADPLKKILSILTGIPLSSFNDRFFKENFAIRIDALDYSLNKDNWMEVPSDSRFNRMVKELDPELTNSCLTIRQLMQYFGTEIMQRYFGKEVWINSTLKNRYKNTIISDLRFKAEAKAVKGCDGIIVYVSRPGYTFGQHASEREMSELLTNNQYDIIIENDGTQEDLFNKIKNLCNDK